MDGMGRSEIATKLLSALNSVSHSTLCRVVIIFALSVGFTDGYSRLCPLGNGGYRDKAIRN